MAAARPRRWGYGHAALAACGASLAAAQGNPSCWGNGFSYVECCVGPEARGGEGNPSCWDHMHTYKHCCLNDGGSEAPGDLEALIARGKTGDSSVLPAVMRILSAGSEECPPPGAPRDTQCLGTPRGPSQFQWKSFFEAQALSKFMRLTPWPKESEPGRLYGSCCEGEDAEEVLQAMFADCAAGTAALVMNQLSAVEKKQGQAAARRKFHEVQRIIKARGPGDCRWDHSVNHGSFPMMDWFLATDRELTIPCGAGAARVFVDDRPEWADLHAHSLSCAARGLCFTEAWVHQFLRLAACRARSREEADFVYVPIYGSCYGLDTTKDERHTKALSAVYDEFGAAAKGPPLLLLMTCEKWKLRGWQRRLAGAPLLVAAVEARPLIVAGEEDEEAAAGDAELDAPFETDDAWRSGARGAVVSHCEDCFDPARDLVIPSAVLPGDAARFRSFAREPERRELLFVWHGEHANSKSREDVAEGYREVNETVRLDVIRQLSNKEGGSVGGPSMRYSFLMGTSHFCLVPKGRGWWTVRLFETFYAGCIPVILSDDQELPFEDFLDWSRFSLKWPMRQLEGLHEHLRGLQRDRPERLAALHQRLREVACWFDYHGPDSDRCSPYLGLLRELARRRDARGSSASPGASQWPGTRRYWF